MSFITKSAVYSGKSAPRGGKIRQSYDGWIPTQKEDLDLKREADWRETFGLIKVDNFLCEHVWEHLTLLDGRQAAKFVFDSLKPGGLIRVSVPDINFPNEEYQRNVQVGGPGPSDHPAADHKIVYDYKTFCDVFRDAGFQVKLLEHCDEDGKFHFAYWHPSDGFLYRSLRFDHRNKDGHLGFASLVIDARKPT